MIADRNRMIADSAKAIYAAGLGRRLEAEHPNRFVAIEPQSADYFVGETFSKAVQAARQAHPDRISFVIRIGHEAALHLGGMSDGWSR
jgi:hypothetical protein